MSRYLRLLVGAIVFGACSSTTSQPVADFTPADMLDAGIDMFGVVADIPHRQYLGETSPAGGNQFPTVYRWLAELTLLDRGSTDVQVAVQDLQAAELADVKEFFRQWYVPNNVIFAIAGDFDPEQVVEVSAVRTKRTIVYYIKDPGAGFDPAQLPHAAPSEEHHRDAVVLAGKVPGAPGQVEGDDPRPEGRPVQPAHEGDPAIDDRDLAVVSKIDLRAQRRKAG